MTNKKKSSGMIKCPQCGKPTQWHGNDFRPFCSERCKMIDLGSWITEEYKVSSPINEFPSEEDFPSDL